MIKNVWIDESQDECVECGACEATCDAIFRVNKKAEVVGSDFAEYGKEIRAAADICPAAVIKFSEENRDEKPIDPDQVSRVMHDILDISRLFYKRDVVDKMSSQTLTFKFAASVIRYMFPDNQVFIGGYRLIDDFSDCINPKLEDVKLVRARWRKPSNKMHWASPYDIEIDRNQIKYIMYVQDIKHKYVKSKRMKANLKDLEVGDLIDFIREQQKIVQHNLPKRR